MFGNDGDEDDDYRDLSKEPDPEELQPSVGPDPPSVDIPEIEDPAREMPTPGEDIDRELYSLFWRLVLVIDIALFSVVVGPLFVYFEGNWDVGAPLFALGVVSFAYAAYEYRSYHAQSDDASEGESETSPAVELDGGTSVDDSETSVDDTGTSVDDGVDRNR